MTSRLWTFDQRESIKVVNVSASKASLNIALITFFYVVSNLMPNVRIQLGLRGCQHNAEKEEK